MSQFGDHDGKSKSASAVDSKHYPDPRSGSNVVGPKKADMPSHEEIAAKAHQIWLSEGRPANSADRIWLQAERELIATGNTRRQLEMVHEKAGSVQS